MKPGTFPDGSSRDSSREELRALKAEWRQHRKQFASAAIDADLKVGVAASFTLDALVPLLGSLLCRQGFSHPGIAVADYNQIVPTCLDPISSLQGGTPDVMVLAWRLEDVADPSDVSAVESSCDLILASISTLRERFNGMIVIIAPPRPRPFVEGLAEFSRGSRLRTLWHRIMSRIDDLAHRLTGCYVVDGESMIARLGEAAALDTRNDLLYRMPMSEAWLLEVADAVAHMIGMRRAESKKCLVLDCDNTIWGGIVGEDGVGGIQLSDDMPGRGFRELQKQIRALRNSGIMIALNSKNNAEDVWEVFASHAGMALKRDDITVARINWKPKSENLREIAADLNIGIDSLVFLDDSHFEIEEVKSHAPQVTALRIPEDPADLPTFFQNQVAPLFHRLEVTEDDRRRVAMMRVEMERKDFQQTMTAEAFLASLNLEVDLFAPAPADLARVTQLINKTNQFNVTTRRYDEGQIRAMIADPDCDIICASVRDRFGEYGLVGVAIVKHGGGESGIDTLLMSCRVLGRGVETSMIGAVHELAVARESERIIGRYVPTPKNGMVKDLFSRHGFESVSIADDERAEVWSAAPAVLPPPDFLKISRF